jgi:HD-like signal output (HDOD) protein
LRILYVGDTDCLPADLDDYLGDLGEEWKISRIAEGSAALQFVASEEIDVAMVAPSLPDMAPAVLLGQMRVLRPETIRVALLDSSGSNLAPPPKLVSLAHRFLQVPLTSEIVLEALYSLEELRTLLNSPRLAQTIGRVEQLPSPPHLYLALNRALEEDEGTIADVANMVAGDPAIAAKVLQLCNSAYFSNGRAIADLRAAVTRLGLSTLRDLVLASEVFSMKTAVQVDRNALQQRALRASRLAARILPRASSELGATAALLADIGLLLPGVRDERQANMDQGADLRPGHTEAGAYLLGLWGLPMPIVEAVAFHRHPQRSSLRTFWVPGAVHVATALSGNEPVDEAYLSSLAVIDKLPSWRQLSDDMIEVESRAA